LEDHRSRREAPTQSELCTTASPEALEATVIAAVPLSRDVVEDLVDRLQQKYKRDIRAEVKVEAGFVGGVRVEIGGEVWDAALRAEIEPIKRPRVHADEEFTLNAPLFGRGKDRSEADPSVPEIRVAPELSMQLGKAICPPPIPDLNGYECLQTNLWVRYPATSTRIMLFVGAGKGCGVSTAAMNLAASLVQNTRARVLLIDANVRLQRSSTVLGPQGAASGSDAAEVSLRRLLTDAPVLQDPTPGPSNLYVLPSGVPCGLPLAVFQSLRFKELLQKARELFQYVVIDGPSLGEHPESLLLSRKADGVILVVESERTRKQSALWAKRQIEMAGGTLLGVLLNRRKHRIPQWLYKRV
jgi:Mrp family chromosome partitioning ATPase